MLGKTVLDYVKNKKNFEFVDGFVDMPKLAGLGVDVNRELVLEENKTPHNWKKLYGIIKIIPLLNGKEY